MYIVTKVVICIFHLLKNITSCRKIQVPQVDYSTSPCCQLSYYERFLFVLIVFLDFQLSTKSTCNCNSFIILLLYFRCIYCCNNILSFDTMQRCYLLFLKSFFKVLGKGVLLNNTSNVCKQFPKSFEQHTQVDRALKLFRHLNV